MADQDELERIALAQALMADITARLEQLAERAAGQQLSRSSDPELLTGVEAVSDLIRAHGRLAPPLRPSVRSKSTRARSKT